MKIFKWVSIGLLSTLLILGAVYLYIWKTPIINEREIQDSDPLCSYLKMDVKYNRPLFDHTVLIDFDVDKRGSIDEYAKALTFIAYQLRHKEIDSVILTNSGQPMLTIPPALLRMLSKSKEYSESDLFSVQERLAENARYLNGVYIQDTFEFPSIYRETPECLVDSFNTYSYEEWELNARQALVTKFWSVLFKLETEQN